MSTTTWKTLALAGAGALAVGLAVAPTADAAAPSVSWHFSDATVSAKQKTTVVWSVAHAAPGGSIVLQRTFGTARTYRTIKTLATGGGTKSGSYPTAAPGQGRYGYRIVALDSRKHAKATKTRTLYSYANVSMATFIGSTTDTVEIDGRLFRYAGFFYNSHLDYNSTTCRYADLQAGKRDGTGYVSFVEENGDGGTLQVPAGNVIYQQRLPIASGALSIVFSQQGDGLFVNGTFSCWTPSGQ